MKELNAGNQRKEVYYQEGSKGECGKARPVLKKKEERKKEAAFSIKDIGRGYILWWYLCTDHPDSISLNYVQYVCPFPTHSSPEIFFFFFFTDFSSSDRISVPEENSENPISVQKLYCYSPR